MRLEVVTAYVRDANKFFNDYIGFLNREIENLPGKTDASRILLWITTIAAHNAQSSIEKLTNLERELPPIIEYWTAGDLISGTPSSPKKSDGLVTKLEKTVTKTTHHLQRAAEMLALQGKMAQSRTYSLQKNAGQEQLETLENFESNCLSILSKNSALAADIKQNKSWLNLELVLGSILFRIKHICNGIFKKSVKRHQDDRYETSRKAQNDLRLIAREAEQTATASKLKLTNNSRALLECKRESDEPEVNSVHFQYFPRYAAQSVESFAQYMRNKQEITRDEVLRVINPKLEAASVKGHRKTKTR